MPENIQKAGFEEKQFVVGKVTLNYVAGPDNGIPLVLIPAQIATWESYQKVLPDLSTRFQVYAVDIRGHGKSSWTTGDYSWGSIGGDMSAFLKEVVQEPAFVSGNSSGGIIALWLAAHVPNHVCGIVLEDAPLFSVEMPRFRDKDRFVYNGLKHLVETIGNVDNRDLADYLRGTKVPLKNGRVKRVPDWIVDVISWFIKRYQKSHPNQPVDIWYFPFTLRLLIKSISQFDPDFARAFVDGRFYESLNHEEALKKVKCPMLILHANWFRHPEFGLVGALDDSDIFHAKEVLPQLQYKKIDANHVIHVFKPKEFVRSLEEYATKNKIIP
ncbi:MAG: alpha/beta hydrolase [Cytophagales bacterium]|jgi:pimeloyl-ACP methyl ester carboxylesterase|nr:alpha/beta hydrolase [Cytophagales bacterium]